MKPCGDWLTCLAQMCQCVSAACKEQLFGSLQIPPTRLKAWGRSWGLLSSALKIQFIMEQRMEFGEAGKGGSRRQKGTLIMMIKASKSPGQGSDMTSTTSLCAGGACSCCVSFVWFSGLQWQLYWSGKTVRLLISYYSHNVWFLKQSLCSLQVSIL